MTNRVPETRLEARAMDARGLRRSMALKVFGQEAEVPAPRVSRRGFVQLVGSGLAMTGAIAACQRPRQKIVPFVRRPPEVTPGNPLNFATALPHEGYGFGVLVESHAGRPTKIEGNPEHPDSLGRAGVRDQAYLLGLYDTDRDAQMRLAGTPAAWGRVLAYLDERRRALAVQGGAGLRFLVGPETSPLLAQLRQRILERFPKARFVTHAPAPDGGVAGAQLVFGRALEPRHTLKGARVIVSLDADFLEDGPESVRLAREFADGRTPGREMSRLYVAEPGFSVTGGMADHRLRVRGSEIVAVAQRLVVEVAGLLGREQLGPLADLPVVEPHANVDARWVKAVARDLARARGRSLVLVGRRQPAAVHALAYALNFALGNVGAQQSFVLPVRLDPEAGPSDLVALVNEIAAGQVDTLVITAHNPVYSAPGDLDLGAKLSQVKHSIYHGLYDDETARRCTTFVPAAHSLESWGDMRALDGTITLVQPLIEPLFSSITAADVLGAFLGEGDRGAYALLRGAWEKRAASEGLVPTGSTFDIQWEHWLARGIVPGTAQPPVTDLHFDPQRVGPAIGGSLSTVAGMGEGIELALTLDARIFDGSFANNAWLHEMPHPMTKLTWDNAVLLSQATAARLGLKTGDWVQLALGGRSVRGPVFVQPGLADESVTVALGYGRQGGESVACGVGFNVAPLRTAGAPWFARGLSVERIGGGYRFGIAQEHPSDEGRQPVRVGNLSEALDPHSEFLHELAQNRGAIEWQIHPPVDYSKEQYKWGMAIDLNRCTGCGACVVACQSENNIPTVGRDQVRIGREMHWIRIDRYYEDAPTYDGDKYKQYDDTRVLFQPIACHHCETAPCEYVCPVNATVHSDEGLNEMVYNRCVGTRYCSNNCPYKARRFNFMDYVGNPTPVRAMLNNPDVTVRSRGVMEKCTYCVQRIERARIDSRVEGRAIADGEIQTACQQTCPAQAIEFGSLNDPNSRVSKLHADNRRYDLLHEVGTRPRTAFLARVRNLNPELG